MVFLISLVMAALMCSVPELLTVSAQESSVSQLSANTHLSQDTPWLSSPAETDELVDTSVQASAPVTTLPMADIPSPQIQTFGLGSGIKLEMVFIQGGSFHMGSESGGQYWYAEESPVHMVELDSFWIGKFEVTQAQYKAIMKTNPSEFKGDNLPVDLVSWDGAVEFCQKLSKRTGKTFTLPTEAQWEYACRAGTTSLFAFGDCLSTQDANYDGDYPVEGCLSGPYRGAPWDVGSGRANAWGLYDMHGNVWEWCLDRLSPYSPDSQHNPISSSSSSYRVYRGGSWYDRAESCRSTYRHGYIQPFTYMNLGFRVVMTE